MWCSALQTHNESVWKHAEEEQTLVENSVRESTASLAVASPSLQQKHSEDSTVKKPACDAVQWDYGGGQAEKENNYQHSQPESCREEREQVDLTYGEEDSQMDIRVSGSSHIQAPLIPNKPRRNQCATCLKCFSAPSKLRRHVIIHTSQRPYGCQLCTKAFRQLAHLKIHMTTHFSPRQSRAKQNWHNVPSGSVPLNQDESLDYCSEPSELTSVTKESKSNQLCAINGEEFKFDENWNRSKVMHECPVCFKCFSAPSKLRRHCLIHTGQRPFQCSTCYRAFRQLAHLKAHYSVHTEPWKKRTSLLQTLKLLKQHQPSSSKVRFKRWVCSSLSRKLGSGRHTSDSMDKCKTSPMPVLTWQLPTQGLTVDRNISERASCGIECSDKNGEGYWCSVCSKHFSAPSKLRRHLLIHTGQRPFKCLVCSRAFTQRSHLKVHRCKGEGRGASEPQLTDTRGLSSSRNIAEVAVNGEQPIMCNTMVDTIDGFIPSGTFTSPSKCIPGDNSAIASLSDRTGADVGGSIVSSKQTKECGHQCTICLKIFDFPSKLSRHLLIHMDVKPFTCTVCSKSFRQLCHLQSHEKVHTAKRKLGYKFRVVTPKPAAASETSELFNRKPDLVCGLMGSSGSRDLSKGNNSKPSSGELSGMSTANTESTSFSLDNSKYKSTGTQSAAMSTDEVFEDAPGHKRQYMNQCTFCLKIFDFPSKLSRHLRIHTGIRPYECHVCHKSFKQLSHLQCHLWIHRKDKTMVVDPLLKQQISSGGATGSEGGECVPGPCQERPERSTMARQGHDAPVDQEQLPDWSLVGFDQNGQCSPSKFDHEDSKIKSEIGLKHETGLIGADGISRNPDWDCQDKPDMNSYRFEEGTETSHPRDIHCCVPEDCSSRSPTVADSCRLGFSHEQQDPSDSRGPKEEAAEEAGGKNLIEPPVDLPICPACSQCFPTMKKLHSHKCPMQVPEERLRKSYHCAMCFKSFEAPSKLKRHYVIHTGQKPFQCTMCSKAFTQSGHLKTHIMSHRLTEPSQV